jgi:hypothetical protein
MLAFCSMKTTYARSCYGWTERASRSLFPLNASCRNSKQRKFPNVYRNYDDNTNNNNNALIKMNVCFSEYPDMTTKVAGSSLPFIKHKVASPCSQRSVIAHKKFLHLRMCWILMSMILPFMPGFPNWSQTLQIFQAKVCIHISYLSLWYMFRLPNPYASPLRTLVKNTSSFIS